MRPLVNPKIHFQGPAISRPLILGIKVLPQFHIQTQPNFGGFIDQCTLRVSITHPNKTCYLQQGYSQSPPLFKFSFILHMQSLFLHFSTWTPPLIEPSSNLTPPLIFHYNSCIQFIHSQPRVAKHISPSSKNFTNNKLMSYSIHLQSYPDYTYLQVRSSFWGSYKISLNSKNIKLILTEFQSSIILI